MDTDTATELGLLAGIILATIGALLHCYIMDSRNTREFGEVSAEETKALKNELRNVRRKKTVHDIIQLMETRSIGCSYDQETDMFSLYYTTYYPMPDDINGAYIGNDDVAIGHFHFDTYQDALNWLQADESEKKYIK